MKREQRGGGTHVASGDEAGGPGARGGEDVAGAERRCASHHRRHLGRKWNEEGARGVEDDEFVGWGPTCPNHEWPFYVLVLQLYGCFAFVNGAGC